MNNMLLELFIIIIIFTLLLSINFNMENTYSYLNEQLLLSRLKHDIRYIKLKTLITKERFIINFEENKYIISDNRYKGEKLEVNLSPFIEYKRSYVKKIGFSVNGNSSFSGTLKLEGINNFYILTIRAADRYYYFKRSKKWIIKVIYI